MVNILFWEVDISPVNVRTWLDAVLCKLNTRSIFKSGILTSTRYALGWLLTLPAEYPPTGSQLKTHGRARRQFTSQPNSYKSQHNAQCTPSLSQLNVGRWNDRPSWTYHKNLVPTLPPLSILLAYLFGPPDIKTGSYKQGLIIASFQ